MSPVHGRSWSALQEETCHETGADFSNLLRNDSAGCKSKKDVPESAEKTKGASNLVEMSVSAQKHIGMVVAPAEVSQLMSTCEPQERFSQSIAGLASSLHLPVDGLWK